MKIVSFFSPGKVIVSGEHSVVYGYPAVVGTIDLGVTVRLADKKSENSEGKWQELGKARTENHYLDQIINVFEKRFKTKLSSELWGSVDGELLQTSGLGSSTSLTCAVLSVFSQWKGINLTPDQMFGLVWEAEKITHPKSSGVDPAVVVYGGLIEFKANNEQPSIKKITPKKNLKFILVDSGKAEESTAEMVGKVAEQKKNDVLKQIGELTKQIANDISGEELNPNVLKQNEKLLEELDIVGQRAQKMIRKIEKAGAVAKVTGAGGVRAGSGWLLCWHKNLGLLEELIKDNNWKYHQIQLK